MTLFRGSKKMWEAEKFAERLRVSTIEGAKWPTKPEIVEVICHDDGTEQLWFGDGSSVIIEEDGSCDVLEGLD
jgi:hypothetical protein